MSAFTTADLNNILKNRRCDLFQVGNERYLKEGMIAELARQLIEAKKREEELRNKLIKMVVKEK